MSTFPCQMEAIVYISSRSNYSALITDFVGSENLVVHFTKIIFQSSHHQFTEKCIDKEERN